MDKWIDFFEPHFANRAHATAFVTGLEGLVPGDPRHPAKIMMHQIQRLISLAEDIDQIRPRTEALRLFFLIVCAEHISKLHANYRGDGQSSLYVRRFFQDFLSVADRQVLETSVVDAQFHLLNLEQVVRLLYEVRCDVVHEGKYWLFQFAFPDMPTITGDPPITIKIGYRAFRDMVIRAGVRAVETYAAANFPVNPDAKRQKAASRQVVA